jgi:hypothetical protein
VNKGHNNSSKKNTSIPRKRVWNNKSRKQENVKPKLLLRSCYTYEFWAWEVFRVWGDHVWDSCCLKL